MNIFNILSNSVFTFSENLPNVPISGVSLLVSKLIEFFSFGGAIAIGIIIFSLLLKILPLPLDIYSRTATKKNALKMEKMRPELEKLQKQYANNKQLYSQKMMALYKKEGYSTMAACLPTLFTLIFFIVVITAFQQYSSYCKLDTFNQMAYSYNQSIIENENVDKTYYKYVTNSDGVVEEVEIDKEEFLSLPREERYFKGTTNLVGSETEVESEFYSKIVVPAQDAAAEKYKEFDEKYSFLWVKNIWLEDLPWKKAFVNEENWGSLFTYSKGCSSTQLESPINNEECYKILTGSPELNYYKEKPNGYLILVVLSIGTMLLSQLLMSKDQKAQMELQSVDGANGQAAQTSKMMMWMMPIMFGIFAFIYTASFSLYLIISTVFSTASTLIINKLVERKFQKQIDKEDQEKFNKRYGYLKNIKKD